MAALSSTRSVLARVILAILANPLAAWQAGLGWRPQHPMSETAWNDPMAVNGSDLPALRHRQMTPISAAATGLPE